MGDPRVPDGGRARRARRRGERKGPASRAGGPRRPPGPRVPRFGLADAVRRPVTGRARAPRRLRDRRAGDRPDGRAAGRDVLPLSSLRCGSREPPRAPGRALRHRAVDRKRSEERCRGMDTLWTTIDFFRSEGDLGAWRDLNQSVEAPGRPLRKASSSAATCSAVFSPDKDDDDGSHGHGLLVLDLTVLSRGERVSFVSRDPVHGEERRRRRGRAGGADRQDRAHGSAGDHRRRRRGHRLRPGPTPAAPRTLIMPAVRCPDCGALIEFPVGVRSGDVVECPNCAGHALRVHEDAGEWSARLAYRVSCPDCDQVITLADGVEAGDTVSCCGQTYTLTFEFGAFAAEKM